ncbi:hypothetical protein [Absidia glauca]|uniref:Swiss Army Knife 2H phosphoesterase domain-containing protein n=1 Tax=Absidia glauca TaxID=4829 RepID=A0A163JXV2_ABSGL|nr:hypothetical protein [Absidia glauca]
MDLIVANGRYLSVVGSTIDAIGKQGRPTTMPEKYHLNRVARDNSERYHITFVHPGELKAHLADKGIPKKKQHHKHIRSMVDEVIATFGEPSTWEKPLDLGLGLLEQQEDEKDRQQQPDKKQKKDKGKKKRLGADQGDTSKDDVTVTAPPAAAVTATPAAAVTATPVPATTATPVSTTRHYVSYFRVIHWPFGQKIRAHLGLPPTSFHITVGFDPKDVHHSPKGPDTILLAPSLKQDPDLLARWVSSAVHYPKESLFLQRLSHHLIKVDLGHLAEPWQHHLKTTESP